MTIAGQAPAGALATRDRLFDVSASLFREKGFAATSIREIARAAGCKSASIYYHVADKNELLFVICRQALLDIMQAVDQTLLSQAPPIERCKQLIKVHLTVMLGERDRHTVMLLEMKSLSPDRYAEILAMRDNYEQTVRELLQETISTNALRGDIAAPMLARLLLGLMNWSIFWFNPDGPYTTDGLSDLITSLFLHGALSANH